MTTIHYKSPRPKWNLTEQAQQHARATEAKATASRPGTIKREAFDALSVTDKHATVRNGVKVVD